MIGAIVIALLVWGPQKIPELAKAVGEAKHEFETVSRGRSDARGSLETPKQQRLSEHEEILGK